MELHVTLQYPNGRKHETVLTSAQAPERGTQFEMYGHAWRVVEFPDSRYTDMLHRQVDPAGESTRILCVCVT
jgi:hypothetical protein